MLLLAESPRGSGDVYYHSFDCSTSQWSENNDASPGPTGLQLDRNNRKTKSSSFIYHSSSGQSFVIAATIASQRETASCVVAEEAEAIQGVRLGNVLPAIG